MSKTKNKVLEVQVYWCIKVRVEVRFDTYIILRVNFKYLRSLVQWNREINMMSHVILMQDELRFNHEVLCKKKSLVPKNGGQTNFIYEAKYWLVNNFNFRKMKVAKREHSDGYMVMWRNKIKKNDNIQNKCEWPLWWTR